MPPVPSMNGKSPRIASRNSVTECIIGDVTELGLWDPFRSLAFNKEEGSMVSQTGDAIERLR